MTSDPSPLPQLVFHPLEEKKGEKGKEGGHKLGGKYSEIPCIFESF